MFKNVIPYRLTEDLVIPDFNAKLQEHTDRPLQSGEASSCGWSAPNKNQPDMLCQEVLPGVTFLRLAINEKIMPATIINKTLNDYIESAESKLGVKISRKEKAEAKNDITFEMLAVAFTKTVYVNAFIDYGEKLICVDSPTLNRAEIFLSFLRTTIGSLPAIPLRPKNKIGPILNECVRGLPIPEEIHFSGKFSIENPDEPDKKTKLAGYDDMSEVEELINHDGVINSASFSYRDDCEFILTSDFTLKSVKSFVEVEGDEYQDDFHANGVDTHGMVSGLIKKLLSYFGGEINPP